MGRHSQSQRLNLWMNGIPVGYWEHNRNGANSEQLGYFDSWLQHPQGRPLSLSLPFMPGNPANRSPAVGTFFDNLLPDSLDIRRRLAVQHRIPSQDAFALLAHLGRDCAGAIQLLSEDETPTDLLTIKGKSLSEADIAHCLRKLTAPLFSGDDAADDLRLSIAGAQEKTALLLHAGQWRQPEGSTPTTHIFKLPLGIVGNMQADLRTSVENEWLCSIIMAGFGIPVARCEIGLFEEQKVLIVERFDRKLSSDWQWIIRLPQEDMCQATGTPATLKYQSEGGPGIRQIMDILLSSAHPTEDRRNFFKTQIIFWLLAATDGHAKNFSIAHKPGGSYSATPIYDVLSAHPIIGPGKNQLSPQKAKLAMAVRSRSNHYLIDKIQSRHWIAQAEQSGLGAKTAQQLIDEILHETPAVIDQASRQLPPAYPLDVAEAIFLGMQAQCRRLKQGV